VRVAFEASMMLLICCHFNSAIYNLHCCYCYSLNSVHFALHFILRIVVDDGVNNFVRTLLCLYSLFILCIAEVVMTIVATMRDIRYSVRI